jgi:hypothetical protein
VLSSAAASTTTSFCRDYSKPDFFNGIGLEEPFKMRRRNGEGGS